MVVVVIIIVFVVVIIVVVLVVVVTIFEKSIRSLSGRADLLIVNARNIIKNGFVIKYWVFPSCAKC